MGMEISQSQLPDPEDQHRPMVYNYQRPIVPDNASSSNSYNSSSKAADDEQGQESLPILPGIVIYDDISNKSGLVKYRFLPITKAQSLFSVDHSIYKSYLPYLDPLPSFRRNYYFGSYLGCLVIYRPPSSDSFPACLLLFNPVKGNMLSLPPVANLPRYYHAWNSKSESSPLRAVLFPSSSGAITLPCYVVLLNYKKEVEAVAVAFCKAGDENWSFIKSCGRKKRYQDEIWCRGRYFFVDSKGDLYTFDFNSTSPQMTLFLSSPLDLDYDYYDSDRKNYLAVLMDSC